MARRGWCGRLIPATPALSVIARRRRDKPIPVSQPHHKSRAMRSETRSTLVRSIAVGRRWLNEIADGSTASPDIIAAREGCSTRHVTKMMSLDFLATDLVKAAIEGRLPHGVGLTRLTGAPIEWSSQWAALGL